MHINALIHLILRLVNYENNNPQPNFARHNARMNYSVRRNCECCFVEISNRLNAVFFKALPLILTYTLFIAFRARRNPEASRAFQFLQTLGFRLKLPSLKS